MNLGFGIDPSQYDFGGQNPEDDPLNAILGDPNASYMDKVLQLKRARDVMSQGQGGQPPQPVTLPRASASEDKPSFFSQNPGLGKGIDAGLATLALILNRKNTKRNLKNPRGTQRGMVDIGGMPTITGKLSAEKKAKDEEALKIQEQNIRAAEQEAKINESAMNRYVAQRNTQMGQVMPNLTRGIMRSDQIPKSPVFQQRLDALKKSEAYAGATPADRNAMELHVLGADPKKPQDTAAAYNRAMATFQGRYDAMKRNGVVGTDAAEKDVADAARFMFDRIQNDFDDPEHAAAAALDYLKNKQTIRTAVGKPVTMTGAGAGGAVPPPPPIGGAPPAPAPAAGPQTTAGLPPDLSYRIEAYKRYIVRHPERKDQLRADILKHYGVDPDSYLGTGQ